MGTEGPGDFFETFSHCDGCCSNDVLQIKFDRGKKIVV